MITHILSRIVCVSVYSFMIRKIWTCRTDDIWNVHKSFLCYSCSNTFLNYSTGVYKFTHGDMKPVFDVNELTILGPQLTTEVSITLKLSTSWQFISFFHLLVIMSTDYGRVALLWLQTHALTKLWETFGVWVLPEDNSTCVSPTEFHFELPHIARLRCQVPQP